MLRLHLIPAPWHALQARLSFVISASPVLRATLGDPSRLVCFDRRSPRRAGRRNAASGAVLILGLVVLLVITMLGITGMRTTVMQERMAGNLRQNDTALQAAEAALQAGLAYIENQTVPPNVDSSGSEHVWPACIVNGANADLQNAACAGLASVLDNWQGDLANVTEGSTYQEVVGELGDSGALPGVIGQPRIYIEVRYVPPLDAEEAAQGAGVHYYTVTAVGFSGSAKARAIVQSTVAKVFQF